jgi:hypothetical protein
MESVFVSFVFIVVATLAYALRTVSRPPAPLHGPAEIAETASEPSTGSESRREAGLVGGRGLLDTA